MNIEKNPWDGIPIPSVTTIYETRRVDPEGIFFFFWAITLEGQYSLILNMKSNSGIPNAIDIPKLQGMDIIIINDNVSDAALIFKLHNPEHRDIFHDFCLDIILNSSDSENELEVVAKAIKRAWIWHNLLRRGSNGKLTLEEQKGLIGELIVLDKFILPNFSSLEALKCWQGPKGAPKDFEIGSICIESKARRSAANPFVTINSEDQLNDENLQALYLHVAEVNPSPSGIDDSFTIHDRVEFIKTKIDNNGISMYEGLLTSVGYKSTDDFSSDCWIEGDHKIYHIANGFPRITSDSLKSGVSRVQYSISLTACEKFKQDYNTIIAKLREVGDGK